MNRKREDFLEQLYRKHYKELRLHAHRFVDDWELTEPIVQETFCIAWKKIDILMECPNAIGWLKNVVKYVAKNTIRQNRKQTLLAVSWNELQFCIGKSTEDLERNLVLSEYKTLLKEDDFYLLRRVVLEGASFQEAANELKIGVWACRKRYQRLLQKCQKILTTQES